MDARPMEGIYLGHIAGEERIMKKCLVLLSLAALTGFTAGCATAPHQQATAQASEPTSCRKLVSPADKKNPVLCGTSTQWAEFDRRAALINAGVTCRWVHTPQERCMTADQWKQYERRMRDYSDAIYMNRDTTAGVAIAQPQQLTLGDMSPLFAP